MSDRRFPGNGINGETGAYLLPPMPPDEVLDLARRMVFPDWHRDQLLWYGRRCREAHLGPMDGVDPLRLEQAGWGIVFPRGTDEGVKRALAPLLQHRQRQAGRLYKELEYGGEPAPVFLARYGGGPGPVNPERVPFYLLLVGGAEELPFELQYQLDVQHAVGRLAFAGPDRYERYGRYAEEVVRAETEPPSSPRRVVLFGPKNPGDAATQLTHKELILPLARELEKKWSKGPKRWVVTAATGPEATRERLRALMGGAETPSLLVTAKHGLDFRPDHPLRRTAQGAFLCQDWGGPGQSVDGCYLTADDLVGGAALRGLIAFHFSCFSAGNSQEPFIAPLADRLLGHPGGSALAVVGHVDRAWGYSFYWPIAGAQREVFSGALHRLLRGEPVGWAMELFNQRYAALAVDVLQQPYWGDRNILHPAALWTALMDARNFVVLGDPAVRLRPGTRPERHQ